MQEEGFKKKVNLNLDQFESYEELASFVKESVYPSYETNIHDLYVIKGKEIIDLETNFEENIEEFKDYPKLKIYIVVRQVEGEQTKIDESGSERPHM